MPSINFKYKDGAVVTVKGEEGETILEIAHRNNISLEGACEGSLACSTCHIILEDETIFQTLEEPTEDEEDMLDLAFGLTATSRLGCQVKLCEGLDGAVIILPEATRNFSVNSSHLK